MLEQTYRKNWKKSSTDIVVRYIGPYAVRTHITGRRV